MASGDSSCGLRSRVWIPGARSAAGPRRRENAGLSVKQVVMVSLGKWKAWEEELGFSGQGNSNNAEGRRSGRGKGDLK